jgi:hypothetical protein
VSVRDVCPLSDLSAFVAVLEDASGTYLAVGDTGRLWENRHELRPVATEFSGLLGLLDHMRDAIDLAEKQWKDG